MSEKYELALAKTGLDNSIIAYRRIADADGSGKCNIHFARDAFQKIKTMGDCCVVALDISSFFEKLDHSKLKSIWCSLIGVQRLPDDHFKVFEAITRYAVVEKQAAYSRLGYYGPKRKSKAGKPINGYLVPYNKMPKQLCNAKTFRDKIAGANGSKGIIDVNQKPFGIPQGSPISDLLANLYLINFDIAVRDIVEKLGGHYLRYSDDILLIAPGGESEGKALMETVRKMIGNYGPKLVIKDKKSSVFAFTKIGAIQEFQLVHGTQGKNGLEYLGFRYDGKKVFIRDSTLTNLYRKVARSSRYHAIALVKRFPNKGFAFLDARFDYEALIQKFGRVEDFGELNDDYRNWTFWTYAHRAAKVFGPMGDSIHRQLRTFRRNVKKRAALELFNAM